MKIGIVMPLAEQRGGAELLLMHVLRADRISSEWNCTLAFFERGPMVEEASALGYPVELFAAGQLRQLHRYIATALRLRGWIKREQVDIVMSWMAKAHLYTGPAALLAGIPAVWWQHGIPTGHWLDRLATRIPADAVFCCSQAAANAQGGLKPLRKTQVIFPAADLTSFDSNRLPPPAEVRKNLGLPLEGPLIGIVGRLQRWKGIHVLVEAMPRILREHPKAHCVVVGGRHGLEPDYTEYLEERIETLGLRGNVILAGLQRNVPEWVQAMDVFVHASDHEPFGIVIVEAMALGKPVVAGDSGGPAEIITEGVDGLFAPFGNSEALARAILRYLNEPALAGQIGAAAAKRAREFSTERFAENLIVAVRSVFNKTT